MVKEALSGKGSSPSLGNKVDEGYGTYGEEQVEAPPFEQIEHQTVTQTKEKLFQVEDSNLRENIGKKEHP